MRRQKEQDEMSVPDHVTRLAQAETAIEELKRGQALIFSKLDAIAGSLSDLRANTGPALRDVLDIGTRIVIIVGAIVSGIVYVARGGASAEMHAHDKRIERLELLIKLPPGHRRALWVPEAAPKDAGQ